MMIMVSFLAWVPGETTKGCVVSVPSAANGDGFDQAVDVVVMGSGAAGLTAATVAHDEGAEVLLLEKAHLFGGTTAVSGGVVWAPLNRHMNATGDPDSREQALTYIRRLTLGKEPDPALVEVFVDRVGEALAYLEDHTPVEFMIASVCTDYYADLPGGRPQGGRSLEPKPFDAAAELGEWASKLRTSPHLASLTMAEGGKVLLGKPVPVELAAERDAAGIRVLGPGLIAALFRGVLDRGIELRLGTAARSLIFDDQHRVIGVEVESDGRRERIGARNGVVLASGGFEWNSKMTRGFLGQDVKPLTPPANEGDGHRMAMQAGAQMASMTSFWGQPSLVDPTVEYEGRTLVQMGTARTIPGVIVVNEQGRRFVNEAVSYHDFPKAVSAYDPSTVTYPNQRHWAIFDHRVRSTATILPTLTPDDPTPDWMVRADTVGELAEIIGVDRSELERTVARWNENAAKGSDPDFGRATMWFEGYMTGGASPEFLQPLAEGPFYALEMHHGLLGTMGGPLVTPDGQVRDWNGDPIAGLYAAGNAMACPFGDAYPGAGSTIAPAITFAYLAGKHIAARSVQLTQVAR